jgi:hypothetical protein
MESIMQPQRLGVFPVISLAIALGFAAAACGSITQMPEVGHSLRYSLVPYKGGLAAAVSDGRIGKHTVWIVLRNPPRSVHREFLGAESNGRGTGGMGSGSSRVPLPAGTYKCAIYSADGNDYSVMAEYWTPKYRVGQAELVGRPAAGRSVSVARGSL